MDELHNVDDVLKKYIPKEELKEVNRIIYGREYEDLQFCQEAVAAAELKKFELKGYKISCPSENLRKPRVVKVGLIQNKIVYCIFVYYCILFL
jgi:beta-ureidopropionase